MRKSQIEAWALRIVDAVAAGKPNEDASVEMKAEWIEPKKAARLIAGHANAARGEPILWLIGLDQKNGVKGAEHVELADWFATVKAQFDGIAPPVTDLNIPVDGKYIVAMLFETDRAPFVVKNASGGSITMEVPWREATSTWSATREQLIRLLSPVAALPVLELMNGQLSVRRNQTQNCENEQTFLWNLRVELYVMPTSPSSVVFPFHHAVVTVDNVPTYSEPIRFDHLQMSRIYSNGITSTPTELILPVPGAVVLAASAGSRAVSLDFVKEIAISLDLKPVGAERPASMSLRLPVALKTNQIQARWALNVPLTISDQSGGNIEIHTQEELNRRGLS